MESKYLIPISIIIVGLLIGGAVYYFQSNETEPSAVEDTQEIQDSSNKEKKSPEVDFGEGHVRGNPDAPVTIVEFSDFQCPFCSRFHPTVKRILEEYPEKVRWVYKHFPLDQLHSQARPAAEASECVVEQKGDQGFWQFADSLFENQDKLGKTLYKELAQDLGLNMEQFNNCISSRKYKDKVEADYQEGVESGVRGTPGSFVNGEEVPVAAPYSDLKQRVEKSLSNL